MTEEIIHSMHLQEAPGLPDQGEYAVVVIQADRDVRKRWYDHTAASVGDYELAEIDRMLARHRLASTDAALRKAWDYEPNLGASTPEPPLSEIVFQYFFGHFSRAKAGELTDRYFAALTPEKTS